MATADGLVVVDKPPGWTSHDVVSRVRRIADTRKVGHAGTLDPLATGVLVLGLGRATRLLGHLSGHTKAYDATIRLGQATQTDDADGEVVAEREASGLSDEAIRRAVAALTGELEQVPSSVSAIKVDGRRAYKRVRDDELVEIAPRPVTVHEFVVDTIARQAVLVDVDVHVECTAGTYVRALARDLGAALGVGGHLTRLRRTRSGRYDLRAAHRLEELERSLDVVDLDHVAAENFATYELVGDAVPAARNGRQLHIRLGSPGPVAVLTSGGEFIALYAQHGPVAKAVAVFSP